MSDKEKAKELVEKFRDSDRYDYLHNPNGITDEQAKQCALICVDEIIQEHKEVHNATVGENFTHKMSAKLVLYWQQVKQEIEKL